MLTMMSDKTLQKSNHEHIPPLPSKYHDNPTTTKNSRPYGNLGKT